MYSYVLHALDYYSSSRKTIDHASSRGRSRGESGYFRGCATPTAAELLGPRGGSQEVQEGDNPQCSPHRAVGLYFALPEGMKVGVLFVFFATRNMKER